MKLNAEQQRAVDCNDKRILCLACAGAGKTQVLISRLWRLVSQDKVNPQKILCLTFTRAAAFEMKERYSKLQQSDSCLSESSFKPEISTFHAFCFSLLLHYPNIRKKLGYITTPKILDPALVKKYQSQAIIQANIKLPLKKLSKNAERSRAEERIFLLYDKAYRRLLIKDNLITFDILCEDVCKLFHAQDEDVRELLDRYEHILIDEFQDTDATQVKFMESFGDASWFCVGDALQNLYSFRGTSNEFIKAYSADPTWTKIRMNQNYRSTQHICEYANNKSTYADDTYRIKLVSDKVGSEVIEHHICASACSNETVSETALKYILESIKSDHETAILCRTNSEVDCVSEFLTAQGITCSSYKKDSTIENILKSSIDDAYMMDWLSTFLSSDKYANYIRLKALEENPGVRWFIHNFGSTFWIDKHLASIAAIRYAMCETKNGLTIVELIKKIKDILDLNFIDTIDCSNLTIPEAISTLIEQLNQAKMSDVYCGTVHSVKGLEFQDVVIVGVDGKHFKLKGEDNKNVFYVAITRAKEHLVVMIDT